MSASRGPREKAMIKRYDPDYIDDQGGHSMGVMAEAPDGDWVSYDDHRTVVDELVEALSKLLTYGVEMDDERIGYVTAQLDRVTIDRSRAALAKAKEEDHE